MRATGELIRALYLAEPDGILAPFLLHPAPGLLERHAGQQRTAHAAPIAEILDLLAPMEPGVRGMASPGERGVLEIVPPASRAAQ